MKAEIVLTGTELLLGEAVDTNSVLIGRLLRNIGLDLLYKTTVGDNEARITQVLRNALNRADVVIVSGGLGPTVDDVTRQAAAAATNRKLVYSTELEAQIAARFARFGRPMEGNNKRQAWLPEGAIPVENPVGTAPCFIVEDSQGIIICLPGVPRELEHQMKHAIIPYLQKKMGNAQVIKVRVLKSCGQGESDIDKELDDLMRLNNPTVGLAAHLGAVDVRITAKAATEAEADTLIAPIEADIRARLGRFIFGADEQTLPEVVGQLLQQHAVKISLVDTLLGGAPVNKLADKGYQDCIAAGVIYPTAAETLNQLNLPDTLSGKAAAQRIAQAHASAGVLGISIIEATENSADKPSAVIALASEEQSVVKQFNYAYGGKAAQQWLTAQALNQIRLWFQTNN